MLRLQAPLPDRYTLASPAALDDRIAAARAQLGPQLLILGHQYQRRSGAGIHLNVHCRVGG